MRLGLSSTTPTQKQNVQVSNVEVQSPRQKNMERQNRRAKHAVCFSDIKGILN